MNQRDKEEDWFAILVAVNIVAFMLLLMLYIGGKEYEDVTLTSYVNKNWPDLKLKEDQTIKIKYNNFHFYIEEKDNSIIVLKLGNDPDIRNLDFEELTFLLDEKISNVLKWQKIENENMDSKRGFYENI